MKIAYIVDGDPNNNRLWSGTVTAIYKSITKKYDVEVIDVSKKSRIILLAYKLFGKLTRFFTGKKFYASFGKWAAKSESRRVTRYLRGRADIDLVLCAAKGGSIAYARTDKRIVYLTDATFDSMHGYYNYLTNLSKTTVRDANEIESRAIAKSSLVICASEWAKRSVVTVYGKHEDEVAVLPFGANLKEVPEPSVSGDTFNILFCGVEWRRKGGDIAVDAFLELKKRHSEARLYLVGCKPEREITDSDIVEVGFLNKNKPDERARLDEIYKNASLLLLPTRAEAAGIVFAEASAHAIPSVATDTGGVGTYVIDGENGYKLPLSATAEDFADKITEIIENKTLYEHLKKRSRELYFERYSWDAWLDSFSLLVEKE